METAKGKSDILDAKNKKIKQLETENEDLKKSLNLINSIISESGFDNISSAMLGVIKDILEVKNIRMYYKLSESYLYVDASGKKIEIKEVDDLNVKEVLISRRMLELKGSERAGTFTRIYPLAAQDKLIGAVKIENINDSKRSILKPMNIFLNYSATLIQNENKKDLKITDLGDHFSVSSAKYDLIREATKVGIWEWDITNDNLKIDERFAQISGLKSEGISTLKMAEWLKNIYPEDECKISELIDKHIKGITEFFKYAFRLKSKNDNFIWVYCRGKVIRRSPDGNPVAIAGVIYDINDSKKAELALKASEEKFRMIAENTQDVIWIYNVTRNKFMYISPSVYNLRGISVEDAMSETLEELMAPRSLKEINQIIKLEMPKIAKGKKIYAMTFLDIQQTCKDGNLIWVEISARMSKNSDGEIEIQGITRNIEKRKKMEEELFNTIKTKDKFFSIIAHDLRNPFNSIIGFSSLLLDNIQKKDYEGIKEYAEYIQISSYQAMDLLKNLLDWSRSQTGTIDYNPEYTDLNKAVLDSIELLKNSALQKSITIENNVPQNVNIMADNNMLKTILRNIISNAIKYTYQGGKISIKLKQTSENSIISISDNGVGMDSDTMSKIFRVEQKHSTLGTNKEKGTGLGLLLCKEFAEKHGGKISVESKKGKGSKFSITIPRIPVSII